MYECTDFLRISARTPTTSSTPTRYCPPFQKAGRERVCLGEGVWAQGMGGDKESSTPHVVLAVQE